MTHSKTLSHSRTAAAGEHAIAGDSTYSAARLLEAIMQRLGCTSYAQTARILGIGGPLLSKMKHRRCPVSSAFLIRVHEACGLEISEMRRIAGDRRKLCRL